MFCPLASCGASLPLKETLSSMSSRYSTVYPVSSSKRTSVG
jgi:hypothetical protein